MVAKFIVISVLIWHRWFFRLMKESLSFFQTNIKCSLLLGRWSNIKPPFRCLHVEYLWSLWVWRRNERPKMYRNIIRYTKCHFSCWHRIACGFDNDHSSIRIGLSLFQVAQVFFSFSVSLLHQLMWFYGTIIKYILVNKWTNAKRQRGKKIISLAFNFDIVLQSKISLRFIDDVFSKWNGYQPYGGL